MARSAQWAGSAASVVSIAALLLLMMTEEKTGMEREVSIKKIAGLGSCSHHPQRVQKKPLRWPSGAAVWEGSEEEELSDEVIYAAKSDFYLGAMLQERQSREDFAVAWKTWCQYTFGQLAKRREGVEIGLQSSAQRRLRRRRLKRKQDPAEEVWGRNLLRNPCAQNDCFFEAISWGLELLGISEEIRPKRMRNMLASAQERPPKSTPKDCESRGIDTHRILSIP